LVAMSPPSPQAPKFFEGKKLNAPASAIVPNFFFLNEAPKACAVSSTIKRFLLRAMCIILSMRHPKPKRCTGTIPTVFLVIAFSISQGSILNVSRSMSTKTGLAPLRAIASAVAIKLKGVVMISSFFVKYSLFFKQMARLRNAMRRASVPEATPIA